MTPAGNEESKDYLNALIASFLGWTLDAFDFFVLVFAVPTIAEEFHVDLPEIAKTITVTLAFRPSARSSSDCWPTATGDGFR